MHPQRRLTAVPAIVFALVALSGCLGGGDAGVEEQGGAAPVDTAASTAPAMEPVLRFDADVLNGTVPLNVTFTAQVSLVPVGDEVASTEGNTTDGNATQTGNETMEEPEGEPYGGDFSWTLDFGDNESLEGNQSAFPLAVAHTYNFSSNFSAGLVVVLATNETLSESLMVIVEESVPMEPEPVADNIHIEIAGSLPLSFPALPDPVPQDGPGGFCWALQQAEGDANNTFAAVWSLDVVAGAKSVFIEGGADTSDPTQSAADYDVVILGADGTCVVGGSEGAYEHAELKRPAEGTTLVGILHWSGPPTDEYAGFIEVRY